MGQGVAGWSPGGDGNCEQQAMSGTSIAAPVITGLAALVGQYFEDGYYPTGVPTRGFWAEPGLRSQFQPGHPDCIGTVPLRAGSEVTNLDTTALHLYQRLTC